MKKLALFVLSLSTVLYSCKKEKENVTPDKGQYYSSLENPNNFEYADLPNWETKMLVATLKKTNIQDGGEDTMYAYSKDGRAYLKYANKEYMIVVANEPPRKQEENASVYTIAIFDDANQLMCYGGAQPSKCVQLGQWVEQRQNFYINQGYKGHTSLAPFNKVIDGIYMER